MIWWSLHHQWWWSSQSIKQQTPPLHISSKISEINQHCSRQPDTNEEFFFITLSFVHNMHCIYLYVSLWLIKLFHLRFICWGLGVQPSGLFGQNQLCSTSLPSSFDCCTHWELFDILKIWLWWLWRIWLSQFVWQSLQPPQQLCLSLSILEIGDIFNTFKSKVVENVEVTKKIESWFLMVKKGISTKMNFH